MFIIRKREIKSYRDYFIRHLIDNTKGMIIFPCLEITHRFQTARPEVRQLLLQYILPWLYNMELVDPNIPPPNSNSSFYQVWSGLQIGCLVYCIV